MAWLSVPSAMLVRLIGVATDLLQSPDHRRLRWILLVGLAVRLALAPLTAWPIDSAYFTQTDVALLTHGSPYADGTWHNPPLGPFLSVIPMAPVAWWFGVHHLVPSIAAMAPMVQATGFGSTAVPISTALFAWKLPLILSDTAVAVALYGVRRSLPLPTSLGPAAVAAAWFLNPLVIWASSIQGEVDTLAILFFLAFMIALIRNHCLLAGLALGLSILSKGYPVIFLLMVLAGVLAWPTAAGISWRRRFTDLGQIIVGAGASALAFLPFLGQTSTSLQSKFYGNTYFGGASLLAAFNPASPQFNGAYSTFVSNVQNAFFLLSVYRGLAVVAVVGAAFGVLYSQLTYRSRSPAERFQILAWGACWALAGVLLADPSPEPENLVGLVPLVLLGFPWRGRRVLLGALIFLSFGGVLLYASLLTPVGVFYPLAVDLGTGSVLWINGVAIAYTSILHLQADLWFVAGVSSGAAILLLWILGGYAFLAPPVRDVVDRLRGGRERVEPEPDGAPGPGPARLAPQFGDAIEDRQ
ncbi:MAG: hypothetical protein L3K03_07120 [Thermoplasmata archaeon]|nr:hypothetical protein [Thermoplasmata archaeon]